jgi:hypothetical protein
MQSLELNSSGKKPELLERLQELADTIPISTLFEQALSVADTLLL